MKYTLHTVWVLLLTSSASVFALDVDSVSITDPRFGAIADDNRDDSAQIQAAIDYAVQNNKSVYIPAGTFNVSQTLDVTRIKGAHNSRVKLYGEKRNLSRLTTNANISLLKVAHNVEVHDLTLMQTASFKQGTGIDIPFASYRSNFSKLDISGFNNGIYGKWVIWSRFEDLFIANVNYGIYLHGNGENPAYWNTEPNGWFNNVNAFDNIYVEGSHTGLKLAAMGSEIANSTVQNSQVGVEIYGPADHKTWNNQISNFYAEGVKTVFKVKNSRTLDINGVFAQGGPNSNRANTVIDADNGGVITVNGFTGQDWWNHNVVLKNTKVKGNVPAIGGSESADSSSAYLPGKITASISLPANSSWVELPSNMSISGNSAYKVVVSGIRDGYEPVLEEYAIYNWNGSSTYAKVHQTSGIGRVKFKVDGGKLHAKLDYNGGGGLSSGKVTLERIH
ncbi:glycoside hydrolase family 55 protein [Pseudoalteromonas piscicida]|uniref:glycoside hydrolase family 55 protein n=1 Tax=Pseudoalteromonas piscicida TaxID=43662 RepID=UPI001C951FCD|nr:glycoside hydrolase family 55 protein [Pseudoalteromonas piscicida]QZO15016.1 glycoside hydrolase family 55 protein [Pseudoalteromonas piscicida]